MLEQKTGLAQRWRPSSVSIGVSMPHIATLSAYYISRWGNCKYGTVQWQSVKTKILI